MKLEKNTYIILTIIVVVIVIIVAIIYFVGKGAGKKIGAKYDEALSNLKIPDELKNILSKEQCDKAKNYAKRLHLDLKGVSLDHDDQLYSDIIAESDRMFYAIYTIFNIAYYDEGSGTLRNWIYDDNIDSDQKDSILQRMNRLKLT